MRYTMCYRNPLPCCSIMCCVCDYHPKLYKSASQPYNIAKCCLIHCQRSPLGLLYHESYPDLSTRLGIFNLFFNWISPGILGCIFFRERKIILLLLAKISNLSRSLCVMSPDSLLFTALFNRDVFKLLLRWQYLPDRP